jgi:hypothetical protein
MVLLLRTNAGSFKNAKIGYEYIRTVLMKYETSEKNKTTIRNTDINDTASEESVDCMISS